MKTTSASSKKFIQICNSNNSHRGYYVIQIEKIERGVRQGDTTSLILFITPKEDLFKILPLEKRGLNIDGERMTDL